MIVRKSDWIRRAILVLAILISGGNLLIPRLPVLFAVVFLYLIARDWVIDFKMRLLPVLVLLACILLLTILRPTGSDLESTAIRFANFIVALLLLDLYLSAGAEALRRDLYVILHVMAWQALVTVALATLFNFLFIPFPVNETPYNTFLFVFNYHVMLEDSTTIIRPDGFFYEPGVFQIYLNIFLYLALFVFRSSWKSALAMIAVFSTQSTTGVLICLVIVFAYIATRYLNRGSLPVRVAKVFAASIVIAVLGAIAAVNVRDKLSGDAQGSYLAREYDLFTGMNIIAENPWFGIGFDYDQYYRASSHLGFADTVLPDRILQEHGNSNGIIFLLYSLGIPLGVPFLIGTFRQTLFPNRVLMGMVLFLGFLGEAIIFTPFFLMIIFSGLTLNSRNSRIAWFAHGV